MALCDYCGLDVATPCTSRVDADGCRTLPAAKTSRPDDLHFAEYNDHEDRDR